MQSGTCFGPRRYNSGEGSECNHPQENRRGRDSNQAWVRLAHIEADPRVKGREIVQRNNAMIWQHSTPYHHRTKNSTDAGTSLPYPPVAHPRVKSSLSISQKYKQNISSLSGLEWQLNSLERTELQTHDPISSPHTSSQPIHSGAWQRQLGQFRQSSFASSFWLKYVSTKNTQIRRHIATHIQGNQVKNVGYSPWGNKVFFKAKSMSLTHRGPRNPSSAGKRK